MRLEQAEETEEGDERLLAPISEEGEGLEPWLLWLLFLLLLLCSELGQPELRQLSSE